MKQMSPIYKIQAQLASMTTGEKKISKFIIDHYDDIIQYNIGDISRKIDVSESSIVRYTKMLGYSGFREFKYACATDSSKKITGSYDEFIGDSDSVAGIITQYLNNHIVNVSNNLQQLDIEALEEVAVLLNEASTIYLAGVYLSGNLALSFYNRLRLLYKDVFFIDSYASAEMQQQWVREGDVVVAITQSGETTDVLQFVEKAKNRGAKIIGVTASIHSSLYQLSDQIILPVTDYKNTEATYISNESIIKLILDSLYIYLLIQKEQKTRQDDNSDSQGHFWFR